MTNAIKTDTLISSVGHAMADGRWVDVLATLAPNVVAHIPAAGDLYGVDELDGFLLEIGNKTDDGEHLELLDTLVGNDFAACYFRVTATRDGRAPLDNRTVHLVRMENDKIAEIWFHNFDGIAVVEFWA